MRPANIAGGGEGRIIKERCIEVAGGILVTLGTVQAWGVPSKVAASGNAADTFDQQQ